MPSLSSAQSELVGATCRTDRYTMAYQLQQLVGSMQFVVQFEPQATPLRLALLRQLREDVACVVPPDSMRPIPPITDDLSIGDLIIAAELIRATLVAAMGPDEQEEHTKLAATPVAATGANGGHIGFRRAADQTPPVNVPIR